MENSSIYLAKFWGWYLIIFFLILSFNPKRIRQIVIDLKDQKFTIIISFLAIIIGLLNLLFHNIWKADYRIIITLFGWCSLLLGLSLFIIPKQTVKWLNFVNIKFVQVFYILLFLIGVYLLSIVYGIIIY
ncbi:hypothetical protein ACFQZW_03925 [Lutibacter aestuarii]|uniref:DUF3397 domain-containing protein n=1 Tax=Lutibacter aestuarii TaxID=861111 RepID=A0ABW2Z478_9FLAO